jgi:predicted Zn-dependent protease
MPTQQTTIIDKGLLKSFISDTYNARQLDQESTGNAIRRDPREVQGGFTGRASCSLTTLEISASSRSVEDVISEVKRGIFVEHFAWPQVDTSTGAFSNEIRNGILIENGELTSQIKYALWVGNLFDALKKPIMVASDAEIHGSSLPPPYSCVMPTIAFQGTEIVGQ